MTDQPYDWFLEAGDFRRDAANQRDPDQRSTSEALARKYSHAAFVKALEQQAAGGYTMPADMAFQLAFALKGLLRGHESEILAVKPIRKGKPPRSLDHDACIADAVRYVRAVKDGRIADPAHTQTVLSAFGGAGTWKGGLNERSIQKWMQDPRFAEIDQMQLSPKMIELRMRRSGERWQLLYSAKARDTRPAKNPHS